MFVSCGSPILHIILMNNISISIPCSKHLAPPKYVPPNVHSRAAKKSLRPFVCSKKSRAAGNQKNGTNKKVSTSTLVQVFFHGKNRTKHPGRLTWNLRIHPWRRKIIFQFTMFRFYVNLRGWIQGELWTFPPPSKEKFTKMPGQWKKNIGNTGLGAKWTNKKPRPAILWGLSYIK